jgi:beta-N-acetylhexosaminidase
VTHPADPRPERRREHARQRAARRRRLALGVLAVAAAGVGVWLGSGDGDGVGDGDDSSDPVAARPAPPSCPDAIASSPRLLAGQMLMVRFEGTATPELIRAARRGEIGGVIAFPPPGLAAASVRNAIARLQKAARDGGNAPLLVATDQEGGEVKRFPLAPPERSPNELQFESDEVVRTEGQATGRYLARLGINVDLAPVLDVGWDPSSFIASRAFETNADGVASQGVAFAEGLEDGGVAATAKHFPGLGRATANTDLGPSVVEGSRRVLRPDLHPFSVAVAAGVSLVMTSSATYPAYDARRPASLSPRITRLLRGRLGFDGVVITDDLLAGAVSGAGYTPGAAAVAAAAAGADLLLFARVPAPEALPALVAALRRGSLDREALLASCIHNLALRESLPR